MNFNKKDSITNAVESVLQQEALKGNQKKIDKNHNNKIDSDDFKILRGEKKVAEEIDVKDRTVDTLAGRTKTDKKDDVGPSSNFKSTKVRFHAGPDNTDDSEEINTGDANKVTQNKKLGMKESKTLKSFKIRYEQHSIYDQMIQEVLSKDASAGDWIHDFVHSDNPKFAGKSKEMRKKMALAAYYAKQRNEELEEAAKPDYLDFDKDGNKKESMKKALQDKKEKNIEEGLSDKLKAVGKKALEKLGHGSDEDMRKDLQKKMGVPQTGQKPVQKEETELEEGLQQNLRKYVPGYAKHQLNKKMDAQTYAPGDTTKQQVDKDVNYGRYKKIADKLKKEEVEQIDEAEMKTKTAYVPYVYTDSHGSGFGGYDVHYSKEADAHAHLERHGHIDRGGKKGWVEKHELAKHPHTGSWVEANHLRRHGLAEESEQVEEGWDDMLKSVKDRAKPQPSGGSGVKLGSRYGGGKQKDKPEHDEDKKKVTESKRPESDDVPFAPPYNTTSSPVVKDKSGAEHTPMSRAKHLARLAMTRMKKDLGKK